MVCMEFLLITLNNKREVIMLDSKELAQILSSVERFKTNPHISVPNTSQDNTPVKNTNIRANRMRLDVNIEEATYIYREDKENSLQSLNNTNTLTMLSQNIGLKLANLQQTLQELENKKATIKITTDLTQLRKLGEAVKDMPTIKAQISQLSLAQDTLKIVMMQNTSDLNSYISNLMPRVADLSAKANSLHKLGDAKQLEIKKELMSELKNLQQIVEIINSKGDNNLSKNSQNLLKMFNTSLTTTIPNVINSQVLNNNPQENQKASSPRAPGNPGAR